MFRLLRNWLAHPLTRGLDINLPATTARRREIVQHKAFLRRTYDEWYRLLRSALPPLGGDVVELGSGAGFLDRYIDGLLTSEVFVTPGVRVVLDATALPFAQSSLRAVVMTDVFHHIGRPRSFLVEAARCLRPGGRIIMVEPWVTSWSRFVYRRLHHEPFEPGASTWECPATGPLSGANGALPWIIFERDRATFEAEFPQLRLLRLELLMPISYLLSGGVSMRSLVPGVAYKLSRALENSANVLTRRGAMFALIVIERTENARFERTPLRHHSRGASDLTDAMG